ncbi:hypothetical protein NCCP2165_23180 [Halomonas sp. NCCP-2165]|nr:hypothetical protein NCCP2165_23180 [Halomonas sp. NCCP-2165]
MGRRRASTRTDRHPLALPRTLTALSIIAFALWQLWGLLPQADAHSVHPPSAERAQRTE